MKKRNTIKTGLLKSINEGQHTCEVSYLGKEYEAVLFSPFGLYSYPDNKIPCLILQINGDEDNLVAIPYDPDNRPTLDKGDAGLKTSNGKMSLFLHKNGKIEITGESDEMVAVISSALGNVIEYAQQVNTMITGLGGASIPTLPNPSFLNLLYGNYVSNLSDMADAKTAINNDKTALDKMKV